MNATDRLMMSLSAARRVAAAAVFGFAIASASAQYATNANFEVEPLGLDSSVSTFPGWSEGVGSEAVNAPVAISGSHSAKLALATAGRLYQALVDTNNALSQWIVTVDFACNSVGSARSFQMLLQTTPSFSTIRAVNLRVVDADGGGMGELQAYNGSAWVTVLTNAVTFSSLDTSLSVNHLRVVGHYADATPNYDVYLTNGVSVLHSALAQTGWQGGAPTPGTTLRQVSFDTGNFASTAFAVVDNLGVTHFGSVNNAPVITTHPASQSVLEGAATVTLTATFSGTPPLVVQWLFNSNSIAGETNATLTSTSLVLSNIAPAMAGAYSVRVTNTLGSAVSSNAILEVRPVSNTAQMANIWNLPPGERPYLSSSGNTERGMAYNPVTGRLLVASRAGGSNTIAALNPATGAEVHLMNLSGVGGGSIDLNAIGLGADGVVYAGNATVGAATIPYYLYRWDDDSASSPAWQVFVGDPAEAVEPNLRWGDNMAVRGSGANTQILLAPGSGTNVVLLRTVSGLDFQTEVAPAVIAISDVPTGFAQMSVAFGPGTNTFWSKNWGGSLRLIEFDLNSKTGHVLRSYNNTVIPHFQSEVTTIAVDNARNYLAALAFETPDNVRFYDVSDLDAGPVLRDQELFGVDNSNPTLNGTGALAFGGDYLFALDSNNGIKAFLVNHNYAPPLEPFGITSVARITGPAVVLTWDSVAGRKYHVLYNSSLSGGSWTDASGAITASGSSTSFTNSVVGQAVRFYRVQGE